MDLGFGFWNVCSLYQSKKLQVLIKQMDPCRVDFLPIQEMRWTGNGMMDHKDIHKVTWRSPDDSTYNQIDHILIDSRHVSNILDVRTFRGANADSDNFLVIYKELSKNALDDDDDVNRKWESTKRSIFSTAEKILKRERAPIIQDWFDNECRVATGNKNKAYRKMIDTKLTRNATAEYKQARRNEKKLHKSQKKCHREKLLEEVERLKSSNESRAFYRAMKKERKDFKLRTTFCKDKNGGIISEKEKVIQRWVEHFDQLLNTGTQTPSRVITEAPAEEYEAEDLIETPTIDEVQDIIDKLKNHQALLDLMKSLRN
ncbi:putative endonuclease-reverse transcriptase [Caerostris darwini]|uniref:Endonuclease-reverse transcriptase n=1 Tax=Caerostris darwini TaxID=1538125 RepID=A0AAV4RK46_9ARAC|nr:putative endonuclease-reverse transcriptase [Caerostris darwini]